MRTKFILDESQLPRAWYNILVDLPDPLPPPLHPVTLQPLRPEDMAPLFPEDLILQEAAAGPYATRFVDIPEPVLEAYRLWRPTPLYRARRLEKLLSTPAEIYYKFEGVSPTGSHKPNTAIAQAFYNKQAGIRRLTTETGAGQWGSALAFACHYFGLECKVYMVSVSYHQKPYRRVLMELYRATVVPSPSADTSVGRRYLEEDPNHPGSLGIAISEAVEDALQREDTHYSLGSVLNHVLLHQTIIGEEALRQMELVGAYPDIVVGCVGGGSNFSGLALPFVREKLLDGRSTRIIAVEPTAAPSLTKGIYTYDFGDTARIVPLLKMHTLGSSYVPPPIHAGGLRYHGMAPIVSYLYHKGLIEAVAVPQRKAFEAGVLFAQAEGIVPAPEASHAIRVVIDEALRCREEGVKRVILFNLCGHGHFDLAGYQRFLTGELEDYEYSKELIERAIAELPTVPEPL
ncbi:MAG: TrpB-like pyridoxal phosphate-dependent enzyme [Candidatus Kapabacteria bacterium]|nr:TrpB-like pyridoxal phosphate-dependent enzyme [Candidatus Kapabacteria bacterium]MDW8012298.1 TrpB-like pyridoxal phosphate-dependent enzyme [Bacteroidota bacterium]